MIKIKDLIKKIHTLITYDIWIMNLTKLPLWKARLYKLLKVILIVTTDISRDRCALRAQALTYSSLLAIVPLFAVVFSVLKGFGFQNKFGEMILSKLFNSPVVIENIIRFINNASVQTLGVVGGAMLLYTSVSLFTNIENTLNDIWYIKIRRSFIRKMTDYLFIVMVVPIFATVALTFSAGNFLGASFVQKILSVPFFKALIFGIYPYIANWIVLFLLYMVLINTKVKWDAALIGSVISGTILNIVQEIYISFAAGVNRYNIIFGSFAQPLLAFIWLNIVWNIVLIGAEIVYAVQNLNTYQLEGKKTEISFRLKEKVAFVILLLIVKQFRKAQPLLSMEEIVAKTQLPIRIVSDILQELVSLGLLVVSFNSEKHQNVYSPAVDTENLTFDFLFKKLSYSGVDDIKIDIEEEKKVVTVLQKFDSLIEKNFGKTKLINI